MQGCVGSIQGWTKRIPAYYLLRYTINIKLCSINPSWSAGYFTYSKTMIPKTILRVAVMQYKKCSVLLPLILFKLHVAGKQSVVRYSIFLHQLFNEIILECIEAKLYYWNTRKRAYYTSNREHFDLHMWHLVPNIDDYITNLCTY